MRELPQLFKSLLTCEGGGATTAGAGSDNFEASVESRAGAETGGATAFTVCETGARELARSRGSCGAGATTFCVSPASVCLLSCVTSGAGATSFASSVGEFRVRCATSGVGGTTFAFKL